MTEEYTIFLNFLKAKGLKLTKQREVILDCFLKSEKHLSTEDLYQIVRKKDSSVGQATVFRTLKLLSEAGIAREIDLGDKRMKFEHKYKHKHHDHLCCLDCGTVIEFENKNIEKLQEAVCRENKFSLFTHSLRILGLCNKCKSKTRRNET